MSYIYSSLPASIQIGDVVINGGAGVAHKKTLITPQGAVTSVTAAQFAILEQNPVFNKYKQQGFIKTSQLKHDADAVGVDMTDTAGGKQATDKTLKTPAKVKKD